MVRVTLMYKNMENANFDFDYYINQHLPLARKLLKNSGLIGIEVEKGLKMLNEEKVDCICISHLDFPDFESAQRSLEQFSEELKADVPNYTNIDPQVQINEVLLKA